MTSQQTTAASRTVAMMILQTPIRRDAEGRYCLNDLHRAGGGLSRHQPSNFIRLVTTKELIEAVSNSWNPRTKPVELSKGRYGGTYVVEDLALDYAAWVSQGSTGV